MIFKRRLVPPAEWKRRTTTSILRSRTFTLSRPAAGRSSDGSAATAFRARRRPAAVACEESLARNRFPSMRKNNETAVPRISNCTSDVLLAIASDRIACNA